MRENIQLLAIFEEQVEDPAHNAPRLGGAHVCTRLLHLENIPLPSSNIGL
jgi:hypothetical protein